MRVVSAHCLDAFLEVLDEEWDLDSCSKKASHISRAAKTLCIFAVEPPGLSG